MSKGAAWPWNIRSKRNPTAVKGRKMRRKAMRRRDHWLKKGKMKVLTPQ